MEVSTLVAALGALIAAATLAAVLWQQRRYRRARRQVVQDRQPLLYPKRTFHVVTFLRIPPGADGVESVRRLRQEIEGPSGARLVWAGQAAFTALASKQLPEVDWQAVVLVSYPSRSSYDAQATSAAYRGALARFERHYSHGFVRPRALNWGVPVLLLGVLFMDRLRRRSRRTPFQPASPEQLDPRSRTDRERLARLRALEPLGRDALVVVNLLRQGTPEQRAADAAYGRQMLGLFAENGHGPMHLGRAVPVEGDARFDHVAIVYYPGIDYFLSMVRSRFFNAIVGDKQPGDTLAVPTVPITDLL